jgi:hypothetical protein
VRKTAAGLATAGFVATLMLIVGNGASAEPDSVAVFDHHRVSDSRQACDEEVFDHHRVGC